MDAKHDSSTPAGLRRQIGHLLFTCASDIMKLAGQADEMGTRRFCMDIATELLIYNLMFDPERYPDELKPLMERTPGEIRESFFYVVLGMAKLTVSELADALGLWEKKYANRNLKRNLKTLFYPRGDRRQSDQDWRDAAYRVITERLEMRGWFLQDLTNTLQAALYPDLVKDENLADL